MKITEVIHEVQKKVKYVVESTLDLHVDSVNVFYKESEEWSKVELMKTINGKCLEYGYLWGKQLTQ